MVWVAQLIQDYKGKLKLKRNFVSQACCNLNEETFWRFDAAIFHKCWLSNNIVTNLIPSLK
jgi:hypothetical protein